MIAYRGNHVQKGNSGEESRNKDPSHIVFSNVLCQHRNGTWYSTYTNGNRTVTLAIVESTRSTRQISYYSSGTTAASTLAAFAAASAAATAALAATLLAFSQQ